MIKLSILSTVVATFGVLMIGGTNLAVAQSKTAASPYQCFTDDGYGRLRSCSAAYKRANPNWQSSDSCYTDDGYGRYRSCSAGGPGYKRKQSNL